MHSAWWICGSLILKTVSAENIFHMCGLVNSKILFSRVSKAFLLNHKSYWRIFSFLFSFSVENTPIVWVVMQDKVQHTISEGVSPKGEKGVQKKSWNSLGFFNPSGEGLEETMSDSLRSSSPIWGLTPATDPATQIPTLEMCGAHNSLVNWVLLSLLPLRWENGESEVLGNISKE